MLDALVGNTDRHHENWALVRRGEIDYLAPSYDHAASLGRNESDVSRAARLSTPDPGYTVQAYANRARSAFYESEQAIKPMLTMDVFATVLDHIPTSRVWLDSLSRVAPEEFDRILERVPSERISKVARAFALTILTHNRERLLCL